MRKNNIGATIRHIRISRGKTQKKVVDSLPYNCNLSAIELGHMEISAIVLFDILEYLNVSPEEFLLIANDFNHNIFDSVIEDMFKSSGILSQQNIEAKMQKLASSLKTSRSPVEKHIITYHRICCFYFLNFEYNAKKAREHFSYLWEYLYAIGNNLLLSDLDLIPLLIPFLPPQQAQLLIEEMLFVLKKLNLLHHKSLLLRAYLNFAKLLIIQTQTDTLPHICSMIEALLLPHAPIAFFAEFHIIKGVMLIIVQSNSDFGGESIQKGLSLAKEHSMDSLVKNWSTFCQAKNFI